MLTYTKHCTQPRISTQSHRYRNVFVHKDTTAQGLILESFYRNGKTPTDSDGFEDQDLGFSPLALSFHCHETDLGKRKDKSVFTLK